MKLGWDTDKRSCADLGNPSSTCENSGNNSCGDSSVDGFVFVKHHQCTQEENERFEPGNPKVSKLCENQKVYESHNPL